MLTVGNSFISYTSISSHIFSKKNGRKFRPISAKKGDLSKNSETQEPILPLRVPNVWLARSAVAVLGLGFIDAGYSGDWSRIGVISRETEEFLKAAAYLVSPLCLFLIFSLSEQLGGQNSN